jgi:hypothetical protein
VRAVPFAGLLLALALGLMALAATTFAASRASRHAMVVLGALGVDQRGRRRVVWWHGIVTAVAVVVVGLPLGLLADLTWWRRQIADLGLRQPLPLPAGVLTPVAVIVAATAIAAAHVAARRFRPTSIAAGLHVE